MLVPQRGSLRGPSVRCTVFHVAFEVKELHEQTLLRLNYCSHFIVCFAVTSMRIMWKGNEFILYSIPITYILNDSLVISVTCAWIDSKWMFCMIQFLLDSLVNKIVYSSWDGQGIGASTQFRRLFHARHRMERRPLCKDCFRAVAGLGHVQTSSGIEKRHVFMIITFDLMVFTVTVTYIRLQLRRLCDLPCCVFQLQDPGETRVQSDLPENHISGMALLSRILWGGLPGGWGSIFPYNPKFTEALLHLKVWDVDVVQWSSTLGISLFL